MNVTQLAEKLVEKYGSYGAEVWEDGAQKSDRADEVYQDDANVHLHLNGEWLCVGYDQMSAPQKYLDRAEAYAKELMNNHLA